MLYLTGKLLFVAAFLLTCQTQILAQPGPKGHLEKALEQAEQLHCIYPDSAQLLLHSLRVDFQQKRMAKEEAHCLWLLGRIEREKKDYDQAMKDFLKAREIYGSSQDWDQQQLLLDELGKLHYARKEMDAAMNCFQRLDSAAISGTGLKHRILARNGIALILNDDGKADSAQSLLEDVLNIAVELGDPELLKQTCFNLGYISLRSRKLKDARHYHELAASHARATGDSVTISRVYKELGTIYLKEKEFSASLDYLIRGYRLREDLRIDPDGIRGILFTIGAVYRWTEDWQNAIIYYEKALEKVNGIASKRALVLKNMSVPRIKLKQYNRAVQELEEAQTIFRGLNDKVHLAGVLNNLGLVYYEQERYQQAVDKYRQAVNVAKEAANPTLLIECQNSLASANYYLKEYDDARATYHEALRLAETEGIVTQNYHLLMGLAETYAATSQYQKAYENYLRYSHLKDSVFNKHKMELLTQMQEKYDSEQKEKDIEILKASQALLESQEESRTLQRDLLILAFLLLLIVLAATVIIFRNRRRSLKMKLQVQEERNQMEIRELLTRQEAEAMEAMLNGREQERQRIAADLHDRIGGLLSTSRLHVSAIAREKDVQHLKAIETLETAYQELRNISHRMDTSFVVRLGLHNALHDLQESINSTKKVDLQLFISEEGRTLGKSWEIALYSIILELTGNALRHAEASELLVQLIYHPRSLTLMVEDNGRGFSQESSPPKSGMGLRSLQARVTRMNGRMTIDSTPGRGTTIIVELETLPAEALVSGSRSHADLKSS